MFFLFFFCFFYVFLTGRTVAKKAYSFNHTVQNYFHIEFCVLRMTF